MQAGEARAIAREWVQQHAAGKPGFVGAYLAGSINELPNDAALDPASDVDVMVVWQDAVPAVKPGKLRRRAVLLEVSYLACEAIATPERVLAHYHLAGAFRRPTILVDPSGHLAALAEAVDREFARRDWVERRSAMARDTVLARLDAIDPARPFHEQVMSWLFAAGGLPHVLLVAGLRNPTVRKRYVAARELLDASGMPDRYEPLLESLGCASMRRDRVALHLGAVAEAFDDAVAVVRSPLPFAADLAPEARSVAIDGSRVLVERGDHREAVFWIAATFARCMSVFAADAPELLPRHEPAFRALFADLDIASPADLPRRAADVRAMLPSVWATARSIMDANPAITEA